MTIERRPRFYVFTGLAVSHFVFAGGFALKNWVAAVLCAVAGCLWMASAYASEERP